MSKRGAILIGVLASVAIAVQNRDSALGFGWAAVHGAGSGALAFLPAVLAWAVVWIGYVWLTHVPERPATAAFGVYALAVVSLSEALLPSTPFKDWRRQRWLRSVAVSNLRDELLRSPSGKPIGIRYRFELVVPRTAEYVIRTTALFPAVADDRHVLVFSDAGVSIEPPPATDDNVFSTLVEDVTYRFSIDLMPAFAGLDGRTKEPCLAEGRGISPPQLEAELSIYRDVRFRAGITVTADGDTAHVVPDYLTVRGYDIYAIYQAIVSDGNRRCSS